MDDKYYAFALTILMIVGMIGLAIFYSTKPSIQSPCKGDDCKAVLVQVQYKTPVFNQTIPLMNDTLYQKTATGCYSVQNKTALALLCADPYSTGKYNITCTPTWNITTCLEK